MYRKIGTNVTIINLIAIAFIIMVGGVSVFLSSGILHNEYKIKEMSEHINIVNSIHTDSLRFMLFVHEFHAGPEKASVNKLKHLLYKVEKNLNDYIVIEEAEAYKGKTIDSLYALRDDFRHLKRIFSVFDEYLAKGSFDKSELLRYEEFGHTIESKVLEINRVHFENIKKWQEESLSKMWTILYIYVAFSIVGVVSVYVGNRLLSKSIVEPVKTLAAATTEFSKGTLDKRVHTDSRTEIGFLYQSFNRMAERLQENDEFLRRFNEELERKVRERTFELKEANTQLHKTQYALIRSEKAAAVGQTAADVTHEIKNPLNSLSINIHMLMKELTDGSSAYQSATLIKQEINRINSILEEFVKFAKFPEPEFFENDMNQVIEEVVRLMPERMTGSDITVKTSLDEKLPLFNFDARQFKEVLMNLTGNAVGAIKAPGEIEIKTEMADEGAIVSVSDTGEGIQEKNMSEIFKPFFSTKDEGMGLGLPIVQRIVENHGGKINCESRTGRGTVFTVTLPLKREGAGQ